MTVRIQEDFTGYPAGKRRDFRAGDMPSDLSPDYEALLIEKGHAAKIIQKPAKETSCK
jgi:hypothetical protein